MDILDEVFASEDVGEAKQPDILDEVFSDAGPLTFEDFKSQNTVGAKVERGLVGVKDMLSSALRGFQKLGTAENDEKKARSVALGASELGLGTAKLGYDVAKVAGEGAMALANYPETIVSEYVMKDGDQRDKEAYDAYLKKYEESLDNPGLKTLTGKLISYFDPDNAKFIEQETDPDIVNAVSLLDVAAGAGAIRGLAKAGRKGAVEALEGAVKAGERVAGESGLERAAGAVGGAAKRADEKIVAATNAAEAADAGGVSQATVDAVVDAVPGLRTARSVVNLGKKVIGKGQDIAEVVRGGVRAVRQGGTEAEGALARAGRGTESPNAAAILQGLDNIGGNKAVSLIRGTGEAVETAGIGAVLGGAQGYSNEGDLEGAVTGAVGGAILAPVTSLAMRPLEGGTRSLNESKRIVQQWAESKPVAERQAILDAVKKNPTSLRTLQRVAETEEFVKGFKRGSGQDVAITWTNGDGYRETLEKSGLSPEEAGILAETGGVTTVTQDGVPVIAINTEKGDSGTFFHEVLHGLYKVAGPETPEGAAYAAAKQDLKARITGISDGAGGWLIDPEIPPAELKNLFDLYQAKKWGVDGVSQTPEAIARQESLAKDSSQYVDPTTGQLNEKGVDYIAEERLAEAFKEFAQTAKKGLQPTARNIAKTVKGDDISKLFSQTALADPGRGVFGMIRDGLDKIGLTKSDAPTAQKGILGDMKNSPEVQRSIANLITAKQEIVDRMLPKTDGTYGGYTIKPQDLLGPNRDKVIKVAVDQDLIKTETDANGESKPVFDSKGNPIFLSPKDKKSMELKRDQTILQTLKQLPESEDPNAIRIETDDAGKTVVRGRYFTPEQITALESQTDIPKKLLRQIKKINDAAAVGDGQTKLVDYQAATKGGGSKYKALPMETRLMSPFGIRLTNQGNLLWQMIDAGSFMSHVSDLARKKSKSLDLWNGDVAEVLKDFSKYTTNHKNGIKGEGNSPETFLGRDEAESVAKKNRLNAILGVKNNNFNELFNPDRETVKGKNFVRSFRLDRIQNAQDADSDLIAYIDYGKQLRNFAPSEAVITETTPAVLPDAPTGPVQSQLADEAEAGQMPITANVLRTIPLKR